MGEEQAVAAEELRVDLGDDGLVGILQRDAPEHAALVAGDEVAFGRDGERDPSALFLLGHEMQELGLKAGLQDEFLGSDHGSGRRALAALGDRGLTIERLTPGLFAVLLDESRGGPGGVSEAGVFPALARVDEGRLPVRAGFSEDGLARAKTEGQRGDTAIVTSEHGDRVHAGLEVAADLGVESLRPIVGAAERLAVEPDDAVIIGGGLQQRLGRDFLQFEGGAEPDFLFRDVVLRAPNPRSLRRGDDGTEAKDGQTEQAEGHGKMRGYLWNRGQTNAGKYPRRLKARSNALSRLFTSCPPAIQGLPQQSWIGGVAEWSIASDSKSDEPQGSGGSNPFPSARLL